MARRPSHTFDVVSAKAGTHSHRYRLAWAAGATVHFNNAILWLWVPAFAGTTTEWSLFQNRLAISASRRCAASRAARIGSAGPVVGPIGTKLTSLMPMKRSASRR
ncbi:hypothetical protein ACVWY5_006285 [Bradyrhizobium sp. USDA 3256]